MHLKKLEIQGFKSFPEYTLVEFDQGMTAIVGPNGSGKSNVTDAIRWVLGEQSVKTLRGGKMEDVIFNGTQSRRAMNFAEVSMTIDNSDGALEIDYSEIQVTRRLYRSGESEYQINRVNCRLKDIITLFMDTGLGKDGYSIVGQGRVDEILSNRSEDRRKVLEEASGIVKYKVRKEEAERKLLATEQNLLRISDVLAELEEQIGPLTEQAEKARTYHKLYEEWRKLDVGLALHLIDRNQVFLSAAEAEEKGLAEDVKAQEDAILSMREKNRRLTEQSGLLEDRLEEYRQKASDISEEIHEIQSNLAVMAERITQINERIAQSQNEDEGVVAALDRLTGEQQAQEKKIETLTKQREQYRQALLEQEGNMAELLKTLNQSEQALAELKGKMEQLQEDLFEKKQSAAELLADVRLLSSREKNLEAERVLSITETDALHIKVEEAQKQLKDLLADINKATADYEDIRGKISTLREQRKTAQIQLEQKHRQVDNVKFRLKTLQELEKNREGYQEPVRRLLAAAEENAELKSATVGVLGELLRVHPRFETAIEIALGQALHNIVTPTEQDASFLIRYLKEHHLGRVTFLPIRVIRPRELEPNFRKTAEGSSGFLGLADEVVDYPPELSDIVKNLLGRIVVMENLQDALALAKNTGHNFRIVTLEGDVVNPGGSMTGGSIRRQGSGLLSRGRELESGKEKLETLEREITSEEKALEQVETEIRSLGTEEAKMDEYLRGLGLEQARAEAQANQLSVEQQRVKEKLSSIDRELLSLEQRKADLEQSHKGAEASIVQCEEEMLLLRQTLEQRGDQNKAEQSSLDELRNDISNLRISVSSLEESLRGCQAVSERILREQEGHKEGLQKQQQERERAQEELEFLAIEVEEKKAQQGQHRALEEATLAEIKEILKQKEEVDQGLTGFADYLSGATGRLASLQNELTKLQSRTERYALESDEWKNRLWEEHELTYDNAESFRIEIENPQPVSRKIADLKGKMRELGPVNLAAIEEYERIYDRLVFMQKQKEDIDTAKAHLSGIIEELTAEMRQQFVKHFEIINENFKVVFSDLFNGGTAEILLEDEEDVLKCGIEIKAQPPGKRLQSLTLLSGGERCLTAIALLFAILQLRPSPFCVLDEVEAALDDVNVNRFTDFVRRYTSKSQFILVTHRKGTMEACDRMYGVTMQERGISKILSMRLGDS